jgi:hypothetical protein
MVGHCLARPLAHYEGWGKPGRAISKSSALPFVPVFGVGHKSARPTRPIGRPRRETSFRAKIRDGRRSWDQPAARLSRYVCGGHIGRAKKFHCSKMAPMWQVACPVPNRKRSATDGCATASNQTNSARKGAGFLRQGTLAPDFNFFSGSSQSPT